MKSLAGLKPPMVSTTMSISESFNISLTSVVRSDGSTFVSRGVVMSRSAILRRLSENLSGLLMYLRWFRRILATPDPTVPQPMMPMLMLRSLTISPIFYHIKRFRCIKRTADERARSSV